MKLYLGVFDLSVPCARERLVREVGAVAAQGIQEQAGDGRFVVFARDEQFTLYPGCSESTVIRALIAGMTERDATPAGGLFDIRFEVGPELKKRMKALLSDHYRRSSGAPNVSLQ